MAGYSGTPLVRKLGFDAAMRAAVIDPPGDYAMLLGIDTAVPVIDADNIPQGLDFLHLFSAQRATLERVLSLARPRLSPTGMIWVSWPKKASKLPSEITEDTVREVALPLGFVDVKVCAVDAIWSGLKLVIRKELR